MKRKPDVSQFSTRRDPNELLEGADEARQVKSEPTPPKEPPTSQTVTITLPKPEPTVQKRFRLRWDVANALKVGAAEESAASGRGVTETEIIERYGSIGESPYRLDIVSFSLETHWGIWMAQAPIEEGEGGSRTFAEPDFRRYPQAEGRFVGLLPIKDGEEAPTVLH